MTADFGRIIQALQPQASDAQADKLPRRLLAEASQPQPPLREDGKVAKAGRDFESILLGSWLQQAEQSFAKVPGGDGQEEDDSAKDQLQGIAMQALAGAMTAAGGIGIARTVSQHLQSFPRTAALHKELTQ